MVKHIFFLILTKANCCVPPTFADNKKDLPVLNDIGLAIMMKAARHSNAEHAMIYLQDALTRFKRLMQSPLGVPREQQLSRWDSIYSDIQTVHQVEQMPPTSSLIVPLPELADWWFVADLGYLPNDPVPSPFDLLETATERSPITHNSADAANISQRLIAVSMNQNMDYTQKMQLVQRLAKDLIASSAKPAQNAAPPLLELGPTHPPPKKKTRVRKGECISPAERKVVTRRVQTHEAKIQKIEAIHSLYERYKDTRSELDGPSQSFFHRIQKPATCFSLCFGKNAQEFVLAHPNFNVTDFRCTTCDGRK